MLHYLVLRKEDVALVLLSIIIVLQCIRQHGSAVYVGMVVVVCIP